MKEIQFDKSEPSDIIRKMVELNFNIINSKNSMIQLNRIVGGLVLAAVGVLSSAPAFAGTVVLFPDNDAGHNGFEVPGWGSQHFNRVNEPVCDGTVSMVATSVPSSYDLYHFSLPQVIVASRVITSLDVVPCAATLGAGQSLLRVVGNYRQYQIPIGPGDLTFSTSSFSTPMAHIVTNNWIVTTTRDLYVGPQYFGLNQQNPGLKVSNFKVIVNYQ